MSSKIEDHANWFIRLFLASFPGQHVEALQALQRLVQAELARRWAVTASPGHVWREAGLEESER